MDNNKENTNLWIGVIVVIVIVAGLVFWLMGREDTAPIDIEPVSQENNTEEVVNSTEDTSPGSVNAGAAAPTISYQDALTKYGDRRIQLDNACQATPNNVTYKNNTEIMIDNRASSARTIKVGSIFNVKAYGFKIVKLTSSTLPATWLVDCDSSQNVATILIQK